VIDRIGLVTDFGSGGPYLGQMRLLLAAALPEIPVVELVSDLSPYAPRLAAYLLPALVAKMPTATLYLCVVDPGVGSDRAVLRARIDGNWLFAPDNGVLAPMLARAGKALLHRVDWRPERLSDSFHGRDLFLPLAISLIRGQPIEAVPLAPEQITGWGWPGELAQVLYLDRFGNLITGLRAEGLSKTTQLRIPGWVLGYARTFCEVPPGTPFWYCNAFGLVEIAVNQGRADALLGLQAGAELEVVGPAPSA
jgi:S-adenosyl-L-methionine hydrolase (adenosine-forming)